MQSMKCWPTSQASKSRNNIPGIIWYHFKHVALIHYLSQDIAHVIRNLQQQQAKQQQAQQEEHHNILFYDTDP
jgi:hypothetical protein